jgi:hypothetical protein
MLRILVLLLLVSGSARAEYFGFRRELMSEFGADRHGSSSRQSLGFEALKKFSTETRTWGALDVQARLVRRDGFTDSPNDREGLDREGWLFEYHNLYADLYDVAGGPGTANVRLGRYYVPFGLNGQTDTHGTLLQLSNERDFGFERDWQAGIWGELTSDLDYGAYWLAGSGYDLESKGQSGLAAARLSLAGSFASEYGLEGGVSGLSGERLAGPAVVETRRAGADVRWRRGAGPGTLAWTTEAAGGRDGRDAVWTQVHQADWLHRSRRWGLSAQFRRFWQERLSAESSVAAEATWYLRNDAGGSALHWIKLNMERQTERQAGPRTWIGTLQYYRYW